MEIKSDSLRHNSIYGVSISASPDLRLVMLRGDVKSCRAWCRPEPGQAAAAAHESSDPQCDALLLWLTNIKAIIFWSGVRSLRQVSRSYTAVIGLTRVFRIDYSWGIKTVTKGFAFLYFLSAKRSSNFSHSMTIWICLELKRYRVCMQCPYWTAHAHNVRCD